jgi:hypothetical protein
MGIVGKKNMALQLNMHKILFNFRRFNGALHRFQSHQLGGNSLLGVQGCLKDPVTIRLGHDNYNYMI